MALSLSQDINQHFQKNWISCSDWQLNCIVWDKSRFLNRRWLSSSHTALRSTKSPPPPPPPPPPKKKKTFSVSLLSGATILVDPFWYSFGHMISIAMSLNYWPHAMAVVVTLIKHQLNITSHFEELHKNDQYTSWINYGGRADPRPAIIQWETSLQCNTVSHWLGTNLE